MASGVLQYRDSSALKLYGMEIFSIHTSRRKSHSTGLPCREGARFDPSSPKSGGGDLYGYYPYFIAGHRVGIQNLPPGRPSTDNR